MDLKEILGLHQKWGPSTNLGPFLQSITGGWAATKESPSGSKIKFRRIGSKQSSLPVCFVHWFGIANFYEFHGVLERENYIKSVRGLNSFGYFLEVY